MGALKGWELGEVVGKGTMQQCSIFCNLKRAKGRKPRKKRWKLGLQGRGDGRCGPHRKYRDLANLRTTSRKHPLTRQYERYYTFPILENFENKYTSLIFRLVISIGRCSAASRVRDSQVQSYAYTVDTYAKSDE